MAQIDAQPGPDLTEMRREVVGRLAVLKRRLGVRLALEGLARTAAGAVALVLLSLVLDHRLELTLTARCVFIAVSLAIVAYLGWRYVVTPLRVHMGPLDLSAALDQRNTDASRDSVLPHVAAVMELPGLIGKEHAPSTTMIQLAVRQSYQALHGVDFAGQADQRHPRRWGSALAAAVLLPGVLALAWPTPASTWASRWLLGSDRPWPRSTTIEVPAARNGVLIVPRGEPVVLRATVTDRGRPTESVWMRLRHADGRKETVTLVRFAAGDFRYDLPPQQRQVTARLYGGDGRTGPITIQPHDRPRITDMTLKHRAPHDTQPVADDFTGRSDVALFKQTDAQLKLRTNVPLAEVRVTTQSGAALVFAPDENGDFAARWTHDRALQTKLRLVAAGSGLLSHPVPVAIGLREDRPPRVNLRFSGVRQRITDRATIPLQAEARDDLGVRSLAIDLSTRTPDSDSADPVGDPLLLYGPVSPTDEDRVGRGHDLEVEALQLSPGDMLTLKARADDDHFAGPQVSSSRSVVFSVVPAEELFREILLRQQGLRATFRKATEQAQAILDSLEGEDTPAQAQTVPRRFRVLRRQVWQVQRDLQASATEMRLNQLGGPEAYDLIQRYVLEPMARLHDQDMDRQRQALESLDTQDPATLRDAADRQAQIVQEMQDILSKMRQWDSFIDVVNQLDEVIKLQNGVRGRTDDLREEQLESIFDE
jgi:hypothetical protein